MKKIIYAVLLLFFVEGYAAAQEYKEGEDYIKIDQQETSSGDRVEVLEFFWYGCPHCYQFEPMLSGWLKSKSPKSEFIRVPAVFRPEWKVHARTYYTLEVMGQVDKMHVPIFDEIHKAKKSRLDKESDMFEFIGNNGINKDEFIEIYKSFSVDNMMRKAIKQLQDYKVHGVPAMAVNGKYLVTGETAQSYENMLRIVDFLIEKESATPGPVKK